MSKKYPGLLSNSDAPLPCLKMGEYMLEFKFGELSPEIREIARTELRETDEIKAQAIIDFRKLLQKETENGLVVPLDNDDWLLRFLRPTKFYPESAFKLLTNYFKFKIKHGEIYDDLLPSKEEKIIGHGIMSVLPVRDQCGRRIFTMELGKYWDIKVVTMDDIFKGCALFLEAALAESETQVMGVVNILDFDGFTISQAMQYTPHVAKRLIDLLQEAMPMRLKGFHMVNQTRIFNMAFAVIKPFLREKLKERTYFHGKDWKSLHKHISPDCLPRKYGGNLDIPKVPGSEWIKLLKTCDQECIEINKLGYKSGPYVDKRKGK